MYFYTMKFYILTSQRKMSNTSNVLNYDNTCTCKTRVQITRVITYVAAAQIIRSWSLCLYKLSEGTLNTKGADAYDLL